MKDFHEIAEARNFNEKNYPYSKQGLASMKVILKSLKWSSVFVFGKIIPYLIRLGTGLTAPDFSQVQLSGKPWFDLINQEINVDAFLNDVKSENLIFLLKNLSATVLIGIENICFFISSTLFFTAVLTIPIWIFFAILRMRNYEREILRNDVEAALMKMDIIRRLNLSERLRELNRRISKAEESKSASDQRRKLDIERFALTTIKRMRVYVNTRQSLNGSEIERQYRIEITPEYDSEAREKMFSELKNLDKTAENAVSGKVSFGALTESVDRSLLTMRAVTVFKDKYDFSDWVEDSSEDNSVYEGTFKLSHLVDRRAQVREISHKAQLWAERSGSALDSFLTTSNAKVDRLSTFVSASNALFTYKISFRIDVQNFEKFQESLDTAFGTSGTTVQIKDGDLLIAIPLPKELIVPIDVGTMYREIFGNDEIE